MKLKAVFWLIHCGQICSTKTNPNITIFSEKSVFIEYFKTHILYSLTALMEFLSDIKRFLLQVWEYLPVTIENTQVTATFFQEFTI